MRKIRLAEKKRSSISKPDKSNEWAGQIISLIKNTAFLGVMFTIVTISYTLWITKDQFVVLPFEVRGEFKEREDVSIDISSEISESINDISRLFSTENNAHAYNNYLVYTEIIPRYIANIPIADVPNISSIQKSIAFSKITLFGTNLPVGEWVLNNFPYFHKDFVKGSVELIDDIYEARISIKGKSELIISSEKSKGFRYLLDLIVAEISNSEKWIKIPTAKAPALMFFSRGFNNYKAYNLSKDKNYLSLAKSYFKKALEADETLDIARLNLAITEYFSWDKADLNEAISNFDYISSNASNNSDLKNKAIIGHVSSILRYLERTNDCENYEVYIKQAQLSLNHSQAANKNNGIYYLLRADINLLNLNYHNANNKCGRYSNYIRNYSSDKKQDVMDALKKIIDDYDNAFNIALYGLNKNINFELALLKLKKRIALVEEAYYSVRFNDHKGAKLILETSLREADEALKMIRELPRIYINTAMPYYRQSIADTYLRLAYVQKYLGFDYINSINTAEDILRETIVDSKDKIRIWSILRLIDLLYSTGKIDEGNEFLKAAFSDSDEEKLFDEYAFKNGLPFPPRDNLCKFITKLEQMNIKAPYTQISKIILIQLMYEAGMNNSAQFYLRQLQFETNEYTWRGNVAERMVAMVKLIYGEFMPQEERSTLQSQILNLIPVNSEELKGFIIENPNIITYNLLKLQRLHSNDVRLTKFKKFVNKIKPDLDVFFTDASVNNKSKLVCQGASLKESGK